jgi:hypothetical protein
MSEPSAFGFGQFVPGFDFLQNLSKTASQAQPAAAAGMPGMGSWVAPTLSIEDIDKRIQELKAVQFWLEQNGTALKATIQALEVQKMTLTTLQGMNVSMADLAKAFTAKPPVTEPAAAAPSAAGSAAAKSSLFTPKPPSQTAPEPQAHAEPVSSADPMASVSAKADAVASESSPQTSKPAVDPMQWWGALTQQFQGIAAAAMKDVAGEAMKAGMAAKTPKAAKAGEASKPPAGRKAAAGKSAASQSAVPTSAKPAAPSRAKASAKSATAKPSTARAVPAKAAARKTTPK